MNVLIIADSNSIHVYNFIKVVLESIKNLKIILLDLDVNPQDNVGVHRYYENNSNIEVIRIEKRLLPNVLKSLPGFKTIILLVSVLVKLRHFKRIDYCFLQYVNKLKALISLIMRYKIDKIVPVFWGSDLLRNKNIKSNEYYLLFEKSYRIIFNTENMYNEFTKRFHQEFQSKSRVIKFPTQSFAKIDKIEKNYSSIELNKQLNFPLDRFIVVCGHSASSAEKHDEMIDAIVKCKRNVLENCYFVFPMTYGYNAQTTRNKVQRKLQKYNLNGCVISKYMKNEDMLKMMVTADIYISVISTDAFSAVLQENLYSKSIVIHGKWLNYIELDKADIYRLKVDTISDLTKTIEQVINNYHEEKSKCDKNKLLIYHISSPEKIRDEWYKNVFGYTEKD